jgi:hypothetical protein
MNQRSSRIALSGRIAGHTLPLGATYFPVLSQAANLNES